MNNKKCPKCTISKPIDCFDIYFSKSRKKYRIGNYCKECRRQNSRDRVKEYYKENSQQRKEYAKRYRENNKVKIASKRGRYPNNSSKKVSRGYVRRILIKQGMDMSYLNKYPEITEAKILCIKIKRKIKKIHNGKK